MNYQYFVYVNGVQQGPFSLDDIRERWRNAPDVLDVLMVWREGMDSWCLLSSLPKTNTETASARGTKSRTAVAVPLTRWFTPLRICVGMALIIVLTISVLLSVIHSRKSTNSSGMKMELSATRESTVEKPELPAMLNQAHSDAREASRAESPGIPAMLSADERLTKDLDMVKTVEDFSNALNNYCDKLDEFTNWIPRIQTLPPVEQKQIWGEIFKYIETDVEARNTAIENLSVDFNKSPTAVKALLRVSKCYGKLADVVGNAK